MIPSESYGLCVGTASHYMLVLNEILFESMCDTSLTHYYATVRYQGGRSKLGKVTQVWIYCVQFCV